jgi:hypothetical protein
MMRYATLIFCLLAGPALAEMYKWTDENGKTHYSDQPPPGVTKTETIKGPKATQATPTPPPAPPGALPPRGAPDPEMEFRKRRVQAAELEAKQQKDAQAAEEKKRNCDRATEQVKAYERGGRVTRYGPNGEQIFLNEQEIQSELVNARKTVDSWCK